MPLFLEEKRQNQLPQILHATTHSVMKKTPAPEKGRKEDQEVPLFLGSSGFHPMQEAAAKKRKKKIKETEIKGCSENLKYVIRHLWLAGRSTGISRNYPSPRPTLSVLHTCPVPCISGLASHITLPAHFHPRKQPAENTPPT